MDSLTHIVLGACIGEAFAGRQVGRKAMLWGALMQSIPDIDFVASFWMNPVNDLLAHRGFTHSFLFIIIVAPLVALVAERWHRPHDISLKKWILFFATEMVVHVLLDGLNNYGTGWFEPFSHYRASLNLMFVADPLFSIWTFIAFVLLLFKRKDYRRRMRWVKISLVLSVAYIGVGIFNKTSVDHTVKSIAAKQGIQYNRYFSTPTPLNNLLWYVVMEDSLGYHLGYRSVFERGDSMNFTWFARNEDFLKPLENIEDAHRLVRFSQGYYTIEKWDSTLVFNDLRFGQMLGWKYPNARFVFHYYLQKPDDNAMVVQRGRFSNWNREEVYALLRRIRGRL